jgi:hypothetical protein
MDDESYFLADPSKVSVREYYTELDSHKVND